MSEVARRPAHRLAGPVRKVSRKRRRSANRPAPTSLSTLLSELRNVLGAHARVVWLPEMSDRERSAWRTRVREREDAGRTDPVVRELRAIRNGRR